MYGFEQIQGFAAFMSDFVELQLTIFFLFCGGCYFIAAIYDVVLREFGQAAAETCMYVGDCGELEARIHLVNLRVLHI